MHRVVPYRYYWIVNSEVRYCHSIRANSHWGVTVVSPRYELVVLRRREASKPASTALSPSPLPLLRKRASGSSYIYLLSGFWGELRPRPNFVL
jgi:hypothetical protein